MKWKPIENLGEIYPDGSFLLHSDYESFRLFWVDLSSGDHEVYYASIDDGGDLVDMHGDTIGWRWNDANYYADVTKPLSPSVC